MDLTDLMDSAQHSLVSPSSERPVRSGLLDTNGGTASSSILIGDTVLFVHPSVSPQSPLPAEPLLIPFGGVDAGESELVDNEEWAELIAVIMGGRGGR